MQSGCSEISEQPNTALVKEDRVIAHSIVIHTGSPRSFASTILRFTPFSHLRESSTLPTSLFFPTKG